MCHLVISSKSHPAVYSSFLGFAQDAWKRVKHIFPNGSKWWVESENIPKQIQVLDKKIFWVNQLMWFDQNDHEYRPRSSFKHKILDPKHSKRHVFNYSSYTPPHNYQTHWEQIQNSLPPGFLIRNQWLLFRGMIPQRQP